MTRPGEAERPGRNVPGAAFATLTILAALAYLPALASSPGRMPADSKLYLYLDPGRFLGTAAGSFDPNQFAGWVPHQHIAYLWPSGPFYWFFDLIGTPDWIAHRLWIGTLFFAAGSGIWWCARRLDLGPAAALTVAVVYQTSVYVLPYVSRTSVMLLPWCGLGWILGLTVTATMRPSSGRWERWRDPALIALVVVTVGAVNATALIMVAPAPALWLLSSLRSTGWRWTLGFVARTAMLSLGVSLWWVAMLVIQGRYGAPVLPYSETLADVSFTSTAAEVWRGLGYWLFYIRDARGPTTTASLPYLLSSRAIAVSYLVPLVGLAGLAATNWRYTRFAAATIGVGGVLAVGVHPIWDRSPLMRLVGDGGLALALRSSTRALPVLMIGVALGCGALVQAIPRRRGSLPTQTVAAAAIVLISLVNIPSLVTASLVDPAIDRDQDPPAAWVDAATSLGVDGTDPARGRILQVPGIEFGAYRWGITVDQPVPGLTNRPLVTRDLLPLGSTAAMDVLYALDDRIQSGVVTPDGVETAGQALGVDTVWLTGDLDYPRYQTARPSDLVGVLETLGALQSYGAELTTPPVGANVDETSLSRPLVPIATVSLVELDRPATIVRADARLVAIAGSGDAFVDSGAVQDIADLAAFVYTADRDAPLDGADALVITDSNRNRNRHWRSSQDATGATLTADDPVSPLERSQRLSVFDSDDTDAETVAVQDGPITAYASRYGEPFGYQPEHRAIMAIDGSPATAWTVGEHGDPIGASLVLTTSVAIDRLEFDQYVPIDGQRRIGEVAVTVDQPGASESTLKRFDLSQTGAAELSATPGSTITITIESVVGGIPATEGIVADVGFTDVRAFANGQQIAPTVEWIRTPIDAADAMAGRVDLPLAVSLRRDRVASTKHWRSDPEPLLRRIVTLGTDQELQFNPTVRLNPSVDDRELAELLGLAAFATSVLDGSPGNGGFAAIDGDPSTAWITGFDAAIGAELHVQSPGVPVNQITLTQPDGIARIRTIELVQGDQTRTINLDTAAADRVDGDDANVATFEVSPPLDPAAFALRITATDGATTVDNRFGDVRTLPVGISALSFGDAGAGTFEPVPANATTDCVPIVDVDGSVLAGRIDVPTVDALTASNDIVLGLTMCDDTTTLTVGEHRIQPATDLPAWVVLDQVEARNQAFADLAASALAASDVAQPTVVAVDGGPYQRTVRLDGCTSGCWLVFGEGYNRGWRADVDGEDLGPATLLDGTANGWWIDGGQNVEVSITWGPQRTLRWAFALSVLTVIACVAIIVMARRGRRGRSAVPAVQCNTRLGVGGLASSRAAITIGAVALLSAFIVGGLTAMLWTIPASVVVVVTRRARLMMVSGTVLVAFVATGVLIAERRALLLPDAAWPNHFGTWHTVGMAAFGCVIAFALATPAFKNAVEPDVVPEDPASADTAVVE